MIENMKSMTCNNSINNINDKNSKKRLNNISNRIKSLEKDINKLKNKETLNNKKSIDNNISIIFDKNNNTMISKESKLRPKNKIKYTISQKSFVKNYLFEKDDKPNIKYNTNNNSYSKKIHKIKMQKENTKSQIYKKMNNYNNIIHEKKNSLFNMKSNLNKRANTKDSYKDFSKISLSKNFEQNKKNKYKIDYINESNNLYNLYKIKIKSDDFPAKNKNYHYMSVDKSNTNYEINDNEIIKDFMNNSNTKNKNDNIVNSIKDNIDKDDKDINNMGKLEYEFEIRHLKKKRNLLKHKNKEIITKLDEIKNKNIKIQNNIVQEEKNNQKIMNNIITLNKNYISHMNPNGLESIESSSNRSFNDDFSLKNIILNIMDIKFDYENNILFNDFIEGINELLNISFLNNNNFNDNILKKIKENINIEQNLKKSNDKYKKVFKENDKYLTYFKSLLKELNLQNYEELYNFVQNMFVKNIKENERMKQIQKALINDTAPDNQKLMKEKENIKRKIANQYSHSVNQNIFNNNVNNCYKTKKTYIDKDNRIKEKKINNYIYSKRKESNFNYTQNILNRTEKSDNRNNLKIDNINNLKSLEDNDNNLKNNYQMYLYQKEKANKYIPLNYEQKKIFKMNASENNKKNDKIDAFMRYNYYNGINNIYNKFINKNNYIPNEDDIIFLNNNEEEKVDGNSFDRKSLIQNKNHSAFNIIFKK